MTAIAKARLTVKKIFNKANQPANQLIGMLISGVSQRIRKRIFLEDCFTVYSKLFNDFHLGLLFSRLFRAMIPAGSGSCVLDPKGSV